MEPDVSATSVPHRLERLLVAARGEPGHHGGDGVSGEQVGRGEGVVGLEAHLGALDAEHPGPTDLDPSAAQRDGGILAAVAVGGPLGVVLALRARDLGDLGFHELGHHVEADGDRGGQQPFLHPLGEQHELVSHLARQPLGELAGDPGVAEVDQADAREDGQLRLALAVLRCCRLRAGVPLRRCRRGAVRR
ncbi:MAG: hypothetical protein ACRD12_14870 [Acidimicrobiales bacterium]